MNTRDQSTPKEALRRFILESAKDYAIFSLDLDRRVTSWGAGAKALLGYEEDEIVGQLGDLFFVPEDRVQGAPEEEAQKAFSHGQAENERWHLRKDGSRFYGSGMTTPLLNEQGSIIGLTKVMRDLTVQKQAEEALYRSQSHMLAIFQTAQVGMCELTLEGRFLRVNKRLCQLLGRETSELIGQSIMAVTFEEDIAPSQKALQQLAWTGEVASLDKRYVKSDGSLVWANSSISLLLHGKDEDPTVLAITVDLTQRKEAEQALKEASRRKDEFLAMLAHELRNPMATIRNGLEIFLLTNSLDSQTQTLVHMMNRQTNHLVRMVDDLLDVSRISRGKIELRKERVNVVELVRQGIDSVGYHFQAKKQDFQIRLPEQPIEMEGDATRLVQVITNLLNNANRYTPALGQITLSVEHQGREVIIQVADTGIGLESHQLSAIFDLFVQVDNSLARTQGGLGIGLTLVKQLVEEHGGSIQAHSKGLGQGSTFSVYLPTLTLAKASLSDQADTISQTTLPRILLVDDNADTLLSLGMLLKHKGYEIHSRTSGEEGLVAAEILKPNVLLLDLGMPGMDGYETCRQIRSQPWGRDLFIVAVSEYGQKEDQRKAEEAGFNRYLTKPVSLEVLLQLLNSL